MYNCISFIEIIQSFEKNKEEKWRYDAKKFVLFIDFVKAWEYNNYKGKFGLFSCGSIIFCKFLCRSCGRMERIYEMYH